MTSKEEKKAVVSLMIPDSSPYPYELIPTYSSVFKADHDKHLQVAFSQCISWFDMLTRKDGKLPNKVNFLVAVDLKDTRKFAFAQEPWTKKLEKFPETFDLTKNIYAVFSIPPLVLSKDRKMILAKFLWNIQDESVLKYSPWKDDSVPLQCEEVFQVVCQK